MQHDCLTRKGPRLQLPDVVVAEVEFYQDLQPGKGGGVDINNAAVLQAKRDTLVNKRNS